MHYYIFYVFSGYVHARLVTLIYDLQHIHCWRFLWTTVVYLGLCGLLYYSTLHRAIAILCTECFLLLGIWICDALIYRPLYTRMYQFFQSPLT